MEKTNGERDLGKRLGIQLHRGTDFQRGKQTEFGIKKKLSSEGPTKGKMREDLQRRRKII